MDNSLLQNKLAKFAGFKEIRFNEPPYEVCWVEDKYGQVFTGGEPDLINDLSAQAEYIYPQLIETAKKVNVEFNGIEYSYDIKKGQWFCLIGFIDNYGYTTLHDVEASYSEKPAVAFALTLGKLIDWLEKNSG
jgi:hypothetical protein